MYLPAKVLLSLLPFFIQTSAQSSGVTTRYWDCCKPSCGWTKKISLASGSNPVSSCDANDNPLSNYDAKSGCNSGSAYTCTNQSPWAVSDSLSYGFAATSISGGSEASWCCACYELTFTSGPVAGKKMIVQSTNTGGDLGSNHFDIAIPGGGFGIFNGCSTEFPGSTNWGAQYGGVSSRAQCDTFPSKLKDACYWRFDWFQNADNPAVTFQTVTCPAALTARSGCVRAGESPTGPGSVPTYTSGAPSSSTVVKSSSTSSSTKVTSSTSTSISKPTSTTTSSKASSTSVSGGAGVARYGQCGGNGYAGSTTCAAPYTCTYSNDWYSQCL